LFLTVRIVQLVTRDDSGQINFETTIVAQIGFVPATFFWQE